MSEEEIKEMFENIDTRLMIHQAIKEPISKDLDNLIKLSLAYEQLRETTKKYKEVIDKAIEYMKDFTFEPLLVNEDRKLIMYNDNLREFEKILKEVE